MCCKIDLNSRDDAAHFMGKTHPTLLPPTDDNIARHNSSRHHTGDEANYERLIDRIADNLKALRYRLFN